MTSNTANPETETDRIERWREETSLTPERHLGTIARIFDTCLELLRILLQHSSPTWATAPVIRKLRQCHSMLQLWDHGHGVAEGRLDNHLGQSTEVRQTTIEVMLRLCGSLLNGVSEFVLPGVKDESLKKQYTLASDLYSQRKWLLKDADESSSEDEESSDDDDDDDEYDSILNRADAMTRRVKTYTDCLMGFGAALDCPAPDDIHENEPGVAGDAPFSAHDYHTELIRRKYDKAELCLLQALGQISWSRFLRMKNERDKNAAITEESQQQTALETTKSVGPDSAFRDSAIGTSLARPQSSYAESIVSFMTSIAGGERVRIPPLPAEGKNGLPFECTACGKLVRATNNREWRKHLYTDLQPYTCFYHECRFSTSPFPSRQLWTDHLELEHKFGPAWEAVQCPLCLNTTGNGKSTVLKHFARHMEDIALVALPAAADSDAGSDASGPLTDDEIQIKPISEGNSPKTSSANVTRNAVTVRYPVSMSKMMNGLGNLAKSFVQLESSAEDMYFVVFDGEHPDAKMVEQYPCKEMEFRRSLDNCIICTRKDGAQVEFVFAEGTECESIWLHLQIHLVPPAKDEIYQSLRIIQPDSVLEPRPFTTSSTLGIATLERRPSSPSSLIVNTGDFGSRHATEVSMCSQCGATFHGKYRKGSLKRHERTYHHETNSFVCEATGCNRTYKRADARLKHYRRCHPELQYPQPVRRYLKEISSADQGNERAASSFSLTDQPYKTSQTELSDCLPVELQEQGTAVTVDQALLGIQDKEEEASQVTFEIEGKMVSLREGINDVWEQPVGSQASEARRDIEKELEEHRVVADIDPTAYPAWSEVWHCSECGAEVLSHITRNCPICGEGYMAFEKDFQL